MQNPQTLPLEKRDSNYKAVNYDAVNYDAVVTNLIGGQIVPFLGAGANLCDRPPQTAFEPGGRYLPTGCELAAYLVKKLGGPHDQDLARAAQYAVLHSGGVLALYAVLRQLFDINYPPTLLHKFLAVLPSALRLQGERPRPQLIVTTNYDDVLERSFHAAREPFDLVCYAAEGKNQGRCWHWPYAPEDNGYEDEEEFWSQWPPKVQPKVIKKPSTYMTVSPEKRHVILKIHGAVDRVTPSAVGLDERRDSFVITEDDYIEFLTRSDLQGLLPINVVNKLKNSIFLFLGYSLRDWNMRVILHRIWKARNFRVNSWAILLESDQQGLDQQFWRSRDVDIFYTPLHDFISELVTRMGAKECIETLDERLKKIEEIGEQQVILGKAATRAGGIS